MDYLVDLPRDECLVAVQAHFVRDWPHKGRINTLENAVVFTENGGCLAPLLFDAKGAQVFATQEGGGSRLTVTAGRAEYSRDMDRWLRESLGARPV